MRDTHKRRKALDWSGTRRMAIGERTGVVVVNYGSHDLISQNLGSVDWGTLEDPVVVVVDNYSSAEERTAVAGICTHNGWELVEQANVGFGAGVNAGVSRAAERGCTVFILINPDAHATAGALAELATHVTDDHLALVGPRIDLPDGRLWFGGGTVLVSAGRTSTAPGTDASAPAGWLSGACIAVHQELWNRIGGFDDEYFLYWEDVDLSWRATSAGGHLVVRDDVRITHSVGGTQQSEGKSPVYIYYNCRNRLLFAAEHLSRRDQLRWLVRSVGYARAVIYRGGRRSFAKRPFPPLFAAMRGTLGGAIVMAQRISRRRAGLPSAQ
jgi:N-acetylglucosaminyl-diphospho-decaprenol L-rhamnosyltransferase